MKIVYATRQHKTEALVHALGYKDALKIETGEEILEEDYILFTYSDKVGETPHLVLSFLEKNAAHLKAVVACGSLQYHQSTYCNGGIKVALEHQVPLLAMVNGRGTATDEAKIKEMIKLLEESQK